MDDTEHERLRKVEQLVRDLFTLEDERGQNTLRATDPEDDRDEVAIELELRELIGLPHKSTEPELQHQHPCQHPLEPCNCRRSHLLAEGRRLRTMILDRDALLVQIRGIADGIALRAIAAKRGIDPTIGTIPDELDLAADTLTRVLDANNVRKL